MTTIKEEYLKLLISEVAKSCNLSDWCYSVKNFKAKAQNYFGELIPVSLCGKTDSNATKLDIVLKLAPTDERFRVSGALTQFFSREIYIYTNVIERYIELLKGLSQSDFIAPKCYYVCREFCKEAIVLQDMRVQSYEPFLDSFLDFNHINASVKSLAQFHALAFILKAKDPVKYRAITQTCVPLTEKNNKRFFDVLLDRLHKAVDKFKDTKYESLFKSLINNYVQHVEAATFSVKETCLCHGDIWKENILFKYEENIPVSACLIDYQTARTCCPAYDILFLIASSTSAILRKHHYNDILDTYYHTFQETIAVVGLNSVEIYSKEDFFKDLTSTGPAVLIVVNTAIWLASGLQQEGHVRSKITINTDEDMHIAVSRYKSVIEGIINDFKRYGYLDTIN